jgi:uncharacterized protein (TIGR02598 family)
MAQVMKCVGLNWKAPARGGCWRQRARHGAFSLVELTVAMAIIGVVVVAVYGAITSGVTTMRLARENLRATQILVEKMEAIRLYTWEQLHATNFIPTSFTVPYDAAAITTNATTNAGLVYHGTFTITNAPLATTYADELRLVTVSLVWTSQVTDMPRRRELKTYVCRTGIQNYIY